MSKMPSEYFKSNIYATFWFENNRNKLPDLIEAVGEDNILFETDFPHPTCLYPNPLQTRGGEDGDAVARGPPQDLGRECPQALPTLRPPSGPVWSRSGTGSRAKPVAGTSGRTGPSSTRRRGADGRGRAGLGGRGGRGGARRRRRPGAPGALLADPAGRPALPAARAARRQPRRAGGSRHPRARQGARRRPGRGGAGHRERRVRLRHPDPPQGLVQFRGLDGRRHPHRARAGRRGGRHHAVQFPRHGAAVDDGQRHRLRELLRAEAVGEGSVRLVDVGRHGAARRASPTAWSTSCRATGRRSTRCSPTPAWRPCPSSAARRWRAHVYETGTRQGKRVQALGGAKNHMVVLPDADLDGRGRRRGVGRIRIGRRAVHGHLGGGGGRAGGRRPRRRHQRRGFPAWSSARATTRPP